MCKGPEVGLCLVCSGIAWRPVWNGMIFWGARRRKLEDLLDRGCIKEELDWDFLLSRQGSHWRILSRRMFKFALRSFQLLCRE